MISALSLIAGWYLLTGAFVLVMHAKRLRDEGAKLTLFWRVNILPWAIVGLALDLAFNVVAGTIMFVELPRELLFTSRCKRLVAGDDETFWLYRRSVALWWQRQLNQISPGHV
jgi:hypothetical protein